jgi:hypothetical protein
VERLIASKSIEDIDLPETVGSPTSNWPHDSKAYARNL